MLRSSTRASGIIARSIAAALWSVPGAGQSLPPDVKARLFAPTAKVAIPARSVVIPLRTRDRRGNFKCPYLRVFVNGKGPFTFLYDTGAAYTVVSSKVVEAAATPVQFDRRGNRDVVLVSTLSVGGVSLHDVWAIHTDDNPGIDGILGAPAFGKSNVLVDFGSREMRISKSRIPLPNSFELAYQSSFNVPTVPMTVGGRAVQILIDTGDDAYGLELRPDELGSARLEAPPVAGRNVMNGETAQSTTLVTLADPVGLGRTRAVRAKVAVNADIPVGDIGYDVLRQFRFVIDPQAGVVRFQPRFRGSHFEIADHRSSARRN